MLLISIVQQKIAWQIIGYNVGLIVLSIILFLANFLDFEDITTIISIIVPVSAVYIGSLFQFLGNSFIPPKNEDRIIKKLKVAQSTINLLTGILLIHF